MTTFLKIVIGIGLCAFLVYELYGLIKAIKKRKADRNNDKESKS